MPAFELISEPTVSLILQPQEYFLVTERIGFRWWNLADLPLAKELWGDPEVTRLFSKEPLNQAQVEDRLRKEIEIAGTHKMQYWPIFERASSTHIGCAGLRPYQDKEKIYELGIHLRPQFWYKGLAIEASRALIDYGATELGANALFAGHHPENAASRQVLLKLGFEVTGSQFYAPTGLNHPSYLHKFNKDKLQ